MNARGTMRSTPCPQLSEATRSLSSLSLSRTTVRSAVHAGAADDTDAWAIEMVKDLVPMSRTDIEDLECVRRPDDPFTTEVYRESA